MNKKQLQLWEKQKKMYESLTEEQLKIVNEYFCDDMKKLRKINDPLIREKKVPKMYYEDLYAVASDTFIESLSCFKVGRGCSFKTFLVGNIERTFYDWTRDSTRLCRCNLQTDRNGKIVKDDNGKVVIIPNISLDSPSEEGIDLCEKVSSGFNTEDELLEKIDFCFSDKIEEYLKKLSKLQRKIVIYLSEGYKPTEIKQILHITDKDYKDCMKAIQSYEYTKILRRHS